MNCWSGLAVRMAANGSVIEPLTDADLEALRQKILSLRPQAVAINLLFSYVDDTHERAIEAALEDVAFVSRSSDVLAEYKEYERGIATWLNAWLGPVVERYLSRLSRSRRAFARNRHAVIGRNDRRHPSAASRRQPAAVGTGRWHRRSSTPRCHDRANAICSHSTWAARPPTCRWSVNARPSRARDRSVRTRSPCRWPTSTRLLPAAVRSPISTQPARCMSGRVRRGQVPDLRATDAAAPLLR